MIVRIVNLPVCRVCGYCDRVALVVFLRVFRSLLHCCRVFVRVQLVCSAVGQLVAHAAGLLPLGVQNIVRSVLQSVAVSSLVGVSASVFRRVPSGEAVTAAGKAVFNNSNICSGSCFCCGD